MSSSIYSECTSDSWAMGNNDPLNALHEHVLATNPDLDTSCLTDDELIALLKSAKDPKDLAYLNLSLAKPNGSIMIQSPGLSSNPGSQFSNTDSSSYKSSQSQ